MITGKILKFPEMNSANIYISEMFRKKSTNLKVWNVNNTKFISHNYTLYCHILLAIYYMIDSRQWYYWDTSD